MNVLRLHYIACIKDCSVCHLICLCVPCSSWGIRSVWMPGLPAVSRVCLALLQTLLLAGWGPVSRKACRACWEHSRDLEPKHREKSSPPHTGSRSPPPFSPQFVLHLSAVDLNQVWNTHFIFPGLFWWAQVSLHFCVMSCMNVRSRHDLENKWNIVQYNCYTIIMETLFQTLV